MEPKDAPVAGMMATTFLIFGIFSGVCFSFLLVYFINEAGATIIPGFVCPTPGNSTDLFWNSTTAHPIDMITFGNTSLDSL